MPALKLAASTVDELLLPVRHASGYGRLDLLPVRYIPDACFTPTAELPSPPWPDLTLSDPADWPSNCRWGGSNGSAPADVALLLALPDCIPHLQHNRDWLLLCHSTSGWRSLQMRCAAYRLEATPAGNALGSALAKCWAESGLSPLHATLDEVEEYRQSLRAVGLDCGRSYRHLAEGAYPIDLDEVAVECLVADVEALDGVASPELLEHACLLFIAPNTGDEL